MPVEKDKDEEIPKKFTPNEVHYINYTLQKVGCSIRMEWRSGGTIGVEGLEH